MQVSQHFVTQEFIDDVTFAELGDASISKIDQRLIAIAELLRGLVNAPVEINNYHYAKAGDHIYHESGLRRPDSPTGAKHSAHKEGKAIDCKVAGMTPAQVHAIVFANEKAFYDAGVRQMEDLSLTPTWTHLGTRGLDNVNSRIQIIKL